MANFSDDPFFTEAEFCWLLRSPDSILPVRNQKKTASCYAHVVTAIMYSNQFLEHKELPREGSIQELVDRLHIYYPPRDFDGNVPEEGLPNKYPSAFRYIQEFGLHTAEQYPFVAKVHNVVPHIDADNKLFIGSYEKIEIDGHKSIVEHLLEKPLTGCILNVLSFRHPVNREGVYEGPTAAEELAIKESNENAPYHALTLVGYGGLVKEKNDYYICQNSYGTEWGHRGYIKVRRHLIRSVYFIKNTRTRRVQLD